MSRFLKVSIVMLVLIFLAVPVMACHDCVLQEKGSSIYQLTPVSLDQIIDQAVTVADQNVGADAYLAKMNAINSDIPLVAVMPRSLEVLLACSECFTGSQASNAYVVTAFEDVGFGVTHGFGSPSVNG